MQQEDFLLLVINPGSTSTKIGVYNNTVSIFEKITRHDANKINSFQAIIDQYEFRKNVIIETLEHEGINISNLSAVVGRGGLLRPIEGGTYLVNDEMLKDLKQGYAGEHASNLGGIIAFEIANSLKIPAFIVDPVVVDELDPIARISGFSELERKSIFHALNQKAVAKRVAKSLNKKYEDCCFIVTHMGGGITIGVHKHGKVVDVNNGLNGEGPFSPERAGTVPAGDLVELCYSRKFAFDEIYKKIVGQGGLVGYLGTNNAVEIENRIKMGDDRAKLVYNAMAYQIAKEIGAASVVLSGKIDAIIITGGLAHGKEFVKSITDRVNWIAECIIKPGEDELQALAEGALRVLMGEEEAKIYTIK